MPSYIFCRKLYPAIRLKPKDPYCVILLNLFWLNAIVLGSIDTQNKQMPLSTALTISSVWRGVSISLDLLRIHPMIGSYKLEFEL